MRLELHGLAILETEAGIGEALVQDHRGISRKGLSFDKISHRFIK